MAVVLVRNDNDPMYRIVEISLDDESTNLHPQDHKIHNKDFLDPLTVAKGFAELANISLNDSIQLLDGSTNIHNIESLNHAIQLKESYKNVIDNLYYYKFPNGVHIFGLTDSHEIVKQIKLNSNGIIDEHVKIIVKFEPRILESVANSTSLRKKTQRDKNAQTFNKLCTVSFPKDLKDSKESKDLNEFLVEIPKQLATYKIIELNHKIVENPFLMDKEEGWLAMFLDISGMRHHKTKNRKLKSLIK